MTQRGESGIVFENWPDCAIEGCRHKCCLALDSVYCFPHTQGNIHVKHMKIGARNLSLLGSVDQQRSPRYF